MDMKVFVDTDSDIRLARRVKRDITERGREIEGVLKQYNKFVKPAFDHYIAPSMSSADVIVPRGKCSFCFKKQTYFTEYRNIVQQVFIFDIFALGGENLVAVNLIVNHVHKELQKVSLCICTY